MLGQEVDEHLDLRREIAARWPEHTQRADVAHAVLQERHQPSLRELALDGEGRQAGNSEALLGEVDPRLDRARDDGGRQFQRRTVAATKQRPGL